MEFKFHPVQAAHGAVQAAHGAVQAAHGAEAAHGAVSALYFSTSVLFCYKILRKIYVCGSDAEKRKFASTFLYCKSAKGKYIILASDFATCRRYFLSSGKNTSA